VSDALTCRRAHHEAGHAIASRRLSLSVTKLTLDGATSRMPVTDSGRQRFATVAYGGPIAEARYCRLTSDQCRKLWTDAWPPEDGGSQIRGNEQFGAHPNPHTS
jgi:hypothetical protein